MRYIADTHTLLWFYQGAPQLSHHVKSLINDPTNEVYISVVSIWEMAIKISIGKLELNAPISTLIEFAEKDGFCLLPIYSRHALAVECLPHHHKDPFDRLLVAQSSVERYPLLSTDVVFDLYDVVRVW